MKTSQISKFLNSRKTRKSKYLDNEMQFFIQVENSIHWPLKAVTQSNLSIADMLYNGHLVIGDTFLRNRPNHGQTPIEKPLYSGHFYSGHLL